MPCFARISLDRSAQASKASSSERTRVLSQSKRICVIWCRRSQCEALKTRVARRSYFRHCDGIECFILWSRVRNAGNRIACGGAVRLTWRFELTICPWRVNWSIGSSRKLSDSENVNKREGEDFLRGIYGGEKVSLWLQVAVSLARRALPR